MHVQLHARLVGPSAAAIAALLPALIAYDAACALLPAASSTFTATAGTARQARRRDQRVSLVVGQLVGDGDPRGLCLCKGAGEQKRGRVAAAECCRQAQGAACLALACRIRAVPV